jgi:hypothetical protein
MNGKQKYLDFREIIITFADFLWDGPTGKLFINSLHHGRIFTAREEARDFREVREVQ